MTRNRREKQRDDRDFDTTSLHGDFHGKILHRDYSAHFFRWSFARRLIRKTDHVLEVGCGVERPLTKILFHNSFPQAESYTGVDLNKLPETKHQRQTLYGEFDFTKRYKEIKQPVGGFDVAVHMEVIEHMKVEHGKNLLKGCFHLLRPGGLMIMSTPVYDGVRHAANHIHEYTVPELQKMVEKAGFVVERRFGTFMDVKEIKKIAAATGDEFTRKSIKHVASLLGEYYDNDALSCIFAPLAPDLARNNLWIARKPAS